MIMKTTSIQLKLKHVSVASLCAVVLAAFSVVTNAQSLQTGDQFSQQQQLTAADGAAFDQFGGAVAISGDTAVVGAPYDTVGGNSHQGSVYGGDVAERRTSIGRRKLQWVHRPDVGLV